MENVKHVFKLEFQIIYLKHVIGKYVLMILKWSCHHIKAWVMTAGRKKLVPIIYLFAFSKTRWTPEVYNLV